MPAPPLSSVSWVKKTAASSAHRTSKLLAPLVLQGGGSLPLCCFHVLLNACRLPTELLSLLEIGLFLQRIPISAEHIDAGRCARFFVRPLCLSFKRSILFPRVSKEVGSVVEGMVARDGRIGSPTASLVPFCCPTVEFWQRTFFNGPRAPNFSERGFGLARQSAG